MDRVAGEVRHDGRVRGGPAAGRRRSRRPVPLVAVAAAVALVPASAGAGGTARLAPVRRASARAAARRITVSDNRWSDAVKATAIPLGDGKRSRTPKVGFVDSCTSVFRGGGAQHSGPWISVARGSWNAATKPTVEGRHRFPAASFHVAVHGTTRVITTNDLPRGEPAGTFPIASSDPAYRYDHNPNSIVAQHLRFDLPAEPRRAKRATCTGLGPIGVTMDGVLLFNALDAAGRDAGAHEIQDLCHGHPNGQDEYHYHSISRCLMSPKPSSSELVGYALDGYGIYAEWNARGALPTNADLDACHGRTSTVLWDGKRVRMYHYDVTLEYPYTVGCFRATPVRVPRRRGAAPGPGGPPPPPAG